jgi:ribosomal protein S18 acetylase RimI-like enzyme
MDEAEIRAYAPEDYGWFKALFGVYMEREFGIELPAPKLEEVCREIARQVGGGIVCLGVLVAGGAPEGFILYQVDTPQSDWCEKEGFGFIREVYVSERLRGQGYGRRLAVYAENTLFAQGIGAIYLTAEKSGAFWEKLGYRNTGEISSNNHDPIFIKDRPTSTAPSAESSS